MSPEDQNAAIWQELNGLKSGMNEIKTAVVVMAARSKFERGAHRVEIRRLSRRYREHHKMLHGDGKTVVGVVNQVRAANRLEANRRWHLRKLWSAIVTMACAIGATWFTGSKQ